MTNTSNDIGGQCHSCKRFGTEIEIRRDPWVLWLDPDMGESVMFCPPCGKIKLDQYLAYQD